MNTIVTPVSVITLDSTRIVHSIKADLVARYFPPVVRLVQYDMSLPVIAVSLMQNGQTYTLPSGAAANIRVHKPDSTYVYNPALGCDSTRNIVYFEVSQAMAAANGDGLAIVEIVVDGDIAGSSLITLHFEDNPVPEDAIESSDEWETIYELGERIIASTVTPVSTAAGMTDHNVVYLYTGTESGWNQGHMYYYNGTTWVDAGIAVTDTTLSVAGLAADAKKTGDEITALKEDLIAKEDFQYEIIQNSYPDASGGFSTYNGWDRTDYISIDGGSDIYIDNTNGFKSEDNAWYDESKGIIGRFTVAIGSEIKITAPANARYMVVSTRRVQFYHEIYHYTARYATKEQLSVVSDNVDANTEAIESLNPVVLPDYYFAENYIQNKIATINENTPLDGVTFAFITDLHFFSNQLKSLPLLQYIRANTSLDTIVSGGDYVQAYGGQADIDFAKKKVIKYAKTLYPDWLSVRGNHDFTIRTDASASTGITEDDRATYYAIVRVSADWRYEVVTPEHDIINTTYNIYKNYNWVATNEQAKVKIIGLCDYNTTKTSAYWGVSRFYTNAYAAYFCQMLNDCDGYTVVVVTHAPITDQLQGGASNRLTEVIEAYANRRTATFGSYSYDFSQATGVIACALSGHWHADQNAVVNGVLHINTTCDALYQDDGYNRTAGTVSEQAFDVINLDTANKTIKITRIGGGNDRNFTY